MAPRRPGNRWSVEQRTCLHMLNTKFDFADENAKKEGIAKIFNHIFKDELEARGFPTGLSVVVIYEDYKFGIYGGRSMMYERTILTGIPDQRIRNEVAMAQIDAAIVELDMGDEIASKDSEEVEGEVHGGNAGEDGDLEDTEVEPSFGSMTLSESRAHTSSPVNVTPSPSSKNDRERLSLPEGMLHQQNDLSSQQTSTSGNAIPQEQAAGIPSHSQELDHPFAPHANNGMAHESAKDDHHSMIGQPALQGGEGRFEEGVGAYAGEGGQEEGGGEAGGSTLAGGADEDMPNFANIPAPTIAGQPTLLSNGTAARIVTEGELNLVMRVYELLEPVTDAMRGIVAGPPRYPAGLLEGAHDAKIQEVTNLIYPAAQAAQFWAGGTDYSDVALQVFNNRVETWLRVQNTMIEERKEVRRQRNKQKKRDKMQRDRQERGD